MDPIIVVMSIITVSVVVFSGVSGHLVRHHNEKFGFLRKWHDMTGRFATLLVVILIILLFRLQ
ncbi:MAG: hypothetical protein HWN65_14115 [Candidatus Helarchaeota archaeon]|nr:hypothetical protein [Candidatus Helarchaeota archaeon]